VEQPAELETELVSKIKTDDFALELDKYVPPF
jgi:hypothetical protein